MATAKLETVTKEVVTTVEEQVVSLQLSPQEAGNLLAVLGHVGGSPHTTPRGDIDSIIWTLVDAGVVENYRAQFATANNNPYNSDLVGKIYFLPNIS